MNVAGPCSAALLVFCKFPTPGRVKTRLASSLGAEAAADCYRYMVESCLREMATLENAVEITICFDPPQALEDMRGWLGAAYRYEPQCRGDLGVRMLHAFCETNQRGTERVVLIGTDCPGLRATHIEEAFDALERHDAVLGPAEDGGYYLIGLRKPVPGLFEDIPWSSGAVLDRTRQAARDAALAWAELETLSDVDTEADLSSSTWRPLPGA